jgi:hypothetical protein
MDLEWARSSLDAERTRVQQLLANLGVDLTDDHEAARAVLSGAATGAAGCRRCRGSWPAGPTGGDRSCSPAGRRRHVWSLIHSGAPIPDERLEADPAAELAVQEAVADRAVER